MGSYDWALLFVPSFAPRPLPQPGTRRVEIQLWKICRMSTQHLSVHRVMCDSEKIGMGKGASKSPEATDAQQKSDDGSCPAVACVIGRLGLTPSSLAKT
ncbi:Uncharacterized protein DAT39_011398 [Clarias magur]|uniref:Uncharacterized protein n=1 Tax=Clarias magur TaxID=1594786 RepID=A0A8J4U3J0_CLAMG|nr:Uncharacterized protein DAT39_011398 [Clarias magur]